MRAVGFLKIDSNLSWSKNVLNTVYTAKICDNEYKLHFPRLSSNINENNYNSNLLPPKIIEDLKFRSDYVKYGTPYFFPDLDSHIYNIVIEGNIPNDNDLELKKLFKNIDSWTNNFINLLKIITDNINLKDEVESESYLLNLFIEENNKFHNPSNMNIDTLIIHECDNKVVSKKMVEKVINLLNNNIDIPAEYEFYLKGVDYFENHNYRNCVLECATAVDLALTNRIKWNFDQKGISDYNSILESNTYNGIDSKYKALIFFDDKQNFDITKITKPRRAIHTGDKITYDNASECIKITKKVLDKFYNKIFK